MIDWEEIIRTESTEELKEAKLWLFQENMRLQQERTELEQAKDKFLEERVTLRDELDALNRRTVMERKRLKEESLFFEKKWQFCRTASASWRRIGKSWKKRDDFSGKKRSVQKLLTKTAPRIPLP